MAAISIKSFRSIFISIMCLAFASLAHGVEVKNLYKSSIIVADRSDKSLRHGSQEALAEVIIRVSGDSRAMESYDITQAMTNPSRFIEQYGYERTTLDNPETGLPEPAYKLKVTFNARSINQLIRRAGLPIWASNRAEVLIWLVIQDENGRRLVNADTAPDIVALLQEQAQRRGLPIAFPFNDLEDQLAVAPGDVWGMFMDRIVEGSARYSPGALLVGKVYAPGAEGRLAAWMMRIDSQQEMIESKGVELAEILSPAVDLSADKLASKYAVTLGGGDTDYVWLNVDGVETLNDFAQLTAYLEKLVAVRQANMGQLQEDKTRFRVYLESDIENLKQLLVLDRKLIEIAVDIAPLSVTLAAVNQEAVIQGNGVEILPKAQPMELEAPIEAAVITAPELNYHWHRTYVSTDD